jgi:hypothetical protein
LLSAISLAAAGMATPPLLVAAAAAAARSSGSAGSGCGSTGAAADAPALPSVSMRAITWSLTTVAPSGCTTIRASTPAAGAGTSSTTLSVSISIRISSIATASPGFFFHCSRVASATDSDSCGTLTSTIAMMCYFLNVRLAAHSSAANGSGLHGAVQRRPKGWRREARYPGSLGQDEALELAVGLVQQRLLLLLVQVRIAHRRRGRGRAAGIAELLAFEHVLVDVVLHEEPGALVLRLVLAPHHFGGVGVRFISAAKALCGKG